MPTPGTYYDLLPDRIQSSGIRKIDEDIETLRKLGILIDGEREGEYLLQIFLQDSAGTHNDRDAGPFSSRSFSARAMMDSVAETFERCSRASNANNRRHQQKNRRLRCLIVFASATFPKNTTSKPERKTVRSSTSTASHDAVRRRVHDRVPPEPTAPPSTFGDNIHARFTDSARR